MYCSMLRGQLAHYKKKKNTPKGVGKLVGDRLPRLFSSDEFYERVVEFADRQKRTEEYRCWQVLQPEFSELIYLCPSTLVLWDPV